MPTHVLTFFAAVSLTMLAAACDRATSPSAPGRVPAKLVSQFQDDAAALIEFRGDIQSVSAPVGTTVYWEASGAGVMQVLVVRDTPGFIQFTLHLANRSKLPEARVIDVSDGEDFLRADASVRSYRVEY